SPERTVRQDDHGPRARELARRGREEQAVERSRARREREVVRGDEAPQLRNPPPELPLPYTHHARARPSSAPCDEDDRPLGRHEVVEDERAWRREPRHVARGGDRRGAAPHLEL